MLILNAGVAAVLQSYTKDNFEMQVGTNHFGHFVLVAGLLDKLKQQVGHLQDKSCQSAYTCCDAYAQAIIIFSCSLCDAV